MLENQTAEDRNVVGSIANQNDLLPLTTFQSYMFNISWANGKKSILEGVGRDKFAALQDAFNRNNKPSAIKHVNSWKVIFKSDDPTFINYVEDPFIGLEYGR